MRTKQFIMISVTVSEMMKVKMMLLTGLSIVADAIAPTQAVCNAAQKTICQR